MEDIEFERVGLGGGGAAGEVPGARAGVAFLSSKDGGADIAVGVGIGVDCAEPDVEMGAGDGWCAVGT